MSKSFLLCHSVLSNVATSGAAGSFLKTARNTIGRKSVKLLR